MKTVSNVVQYKTILRVLLIRIYLSPFLRVVLQINYFTMFNYKLDWFNNQEVEHFFKISFWKKAASEERTFNLRSYHTKFEFIVCSSRT